MARRKKPEGETPEQALARRTLETIANAATRSEKVSWDRKMDNMVKMLTKLRPIEDKIVALMAQKIPLFDEIAALRGEMVKDCIHPYSHLVLKQTDGNEYVTCKFCMRNFSVKP